MFKAMILLKRREDMSFAQFSDWWLVAHAPLAAALPKLRRATFNLVEGDGAGLYDGVSELWFDSREDFDAAYATDHGKAVAADSMSRVSRRERLFVSAHELL
jgi:uncharacterized protein (TIGR02118 family)